LSPALIGQLLDVHADELLVVVQQELDHGPPEIAPSLPQQGELFPVSPMATASGPADCNSAVPQQHDVYTGTGNPVADVLVIAAQPQADDLHDDSARRDEGDMRGGSRCLVAPDAGAGPGVSGHQVRNPDPVADRGWNFSTAAQHAEQYRLTLTLVGDVYTLSSPIFGLAHFTSLSSAVGALRQYGRMCDQLAAEAAALRPTNPNPGWRQRA
jgi:hypothetical protein